MELKDFSAAHTPRDRSSIPGAAEGGVGPAGQGVRVRGAFRGTRPSPDAMRAGDYKTGKHWSCSAFPSLRGGLELQLASPQVNPGCLNEPQRSSLPFPWAHSRTQMQAHTSVNVQQRRREKKQLRARSCWL